MNGRNIKLFDVSGKNSQFFLDVCSYLNTEPADYFIEKFADGDTHVIVKDSLRNQHAFLFCNYIPPIGERFYELALAINGAKSRHPDSLSVIMPLHFGSRAERRTTGGEAINLNVIMKMLKDDVDRVITVNAHTQSINALYDSMGIEYLDLDVTPIVANYYMERFKGIDSYTSAAMDAGGTKDAKKVAKLITQLSGKDVNYVIVDKDRIAPNQISDEPPKVIGEPREYCLVKEDMIDTGGTMRKGTKALKHAGTSFISNYATHPIFTRNSVAEFLQDIQNGTIDELVIGNTLPIKDEFKDNPKIKIISYAPLVGEAIKTISQGKSTGKLWDPAYVTQIYKRVGNLGNMSLPE